jgi:hypothetical protein
MRLVWFEAANGAHFGFIIGLMAQHEACRDDPYFTPGRQSYPQAWGDFPEIDEGFLRTTIVN